MVGNDAANIGAAHIRDIAEWIEFKRDETGDEWAMLGGGDGERR
ncbi:MAG: hypothetical protein OER90_04265 [Gemmatimonadota bacterium]|nr:hypothetical protein [Gemmatimonadota bacterium]